MASFGLLGITISEEYGGSGADFVTAAIATEKLLGPYCQHGYRCLLSGKLTAGFLMDRCESTKAKEELLPDVTKGKTFLGNRFD